MATDETLNSRQLAFAILRNVTEKKQPLDVALAEGFQKYSSEDERDRGFARHLVTSCLRRLGFIDQILNGAMDNPLGAKDLGARNWMRLGVTQLLFMNVESHAAVHTTVELMSNSPTKGIRGKKGMANAILRRFASKKEVLLEKANSNPSVNLPEWLLKRWQHHYGNETVNKICHSLLTEPPLDLTIKDPATAPQICADLGGELVAENSCRLQKAGVVTALHGFNDGTWWVQDMAAALPARLMGDIKGKTVADLAAAPGGKTMQLCAMGAHVIAVDVSNKRLKRVYENLARTNLSATIIETNILNWHPDEEVDAILLDAPCTATGTFRRRPDVALHKSEEDIYNLSVIQKKLLDHSFQFLKEGGCLIYCTCSLEKEEGEDVVEEFLKETPFATRQPFTTEEILKLKPLPFSVLNEYGDIRTTPNMLQELGGMDGFFISRITKTKS